MNLENGAGVFYFEWNASMSTNDPSSYEESPREARSLSQKIEKSF